MFSQVSIFLVSSSMFQQGMYLEFIEFFSNFESFKNICGVEKSPTFVHHKKLSTVSIVQGARKKPLANTES